MEGEDNITAKQLAEIIRNRDVRCQSGGKEYLLLIKEEGNHRCVLMASDCEQAIWTKPLDIAFFMAKRKDMLLTSSLKVFAEHFVKNLERTKKVQRVKTHLVLHFSMRIGEGIELNSNASLESRVHSNNPDEFKLALRKFMLYLWEVKSAQLHGQIEKQQEERRAKEEQEKLERENDKSRNMFVRDNKSKRISLKHRDLVNPERKKRKKNGARLGSGYDEHRVMEVPDDFEL